MSGHVTLEFAGTVWRSNTVTEAEAEEIIANVRGKFFFAPISFKIEFHEATSYFDHPIMFDMGEDDCCER